jgi:hypothetical protein
LLGSVVQHRQSGLARVLLAGGVFAALLGVFFTATRVAIVILFLLIVVATLSGELKGGYRFGWVALLALVGFVISGSERLQRFLSLTNTEEVVDRIGGSVNMTFVEVLFRYPMGNGMGAGGTSLPYFLQDLLTDRVMLENEYGRILLEQGLIGLALWVAFFAWAFTRPAPPAGSSWLLGWRLLWYGCAASCAAAVLGTGLMTSIPSTPLTFLGIGMLVAYRGDPVQRRRRRRSRPAAQGPAPPPPPVPEPAGV